MQSLAGVTADELKASAQVPLIKFSIYYGGAWVNLCDLGSKNYVKDVTLSLGGATMSSDPVAGTWSATIDNVDNAFLPANTGGAYYDYLTTGRKVMIQVGGTYSGGDVYWQRIRGVMDAPEFTIAPNEVRLKGMDFFQYLSDYKLRSPDNYWGDSVTKSTTGPTETLGAEIYAEADAVTIGAGEANNVTNWTSEDSVATPSSVADVGGGSTYAMKILFGSGAVTKTYATGGTYSWTCPTGVTSVQVQCWGAGAGAGGGLDTEEAGGGGGGGGAYAIDTAVTVTPGTDYVIKVGKKGTGSYGNDGNPGEMSYFKSSATVKAAGGSGGSVADGSGGAGGNGGAAASSVGDTTYSGGNGGAGSASTGGGGGSSAGTAANGNNGTSGAGGGAGGAAPVGGGVGGDGGATDTSGSAPASGNGGGGGGAGFADAIETDAGNGADGKVILSYTGSGDEDTITNTNVGAVTTDTVYKLTFKHKRVTGPGKLACRAYVGTTRQGEVINLYASSYTSSTFYFTASDTGNLILNFDVTEAASGTEFRVDQISIKPVTSILYVRNYSMPSDCTGIYYATLDEGGGEGAQPIWYGEDPDGYFYDAVNNEFQFHPNRAVQAGTSNLVIYYHTHQAPEDVIADILVDTGRYANRTAALADMTYTDTEMVIDRVWFEAGTTALKAIQMICERCNYRFYFKYDGTPVFIPPPTMDAAGSEDAKFEECHVADVRYYEDASEIYNRISINGEKMAQPLGTEQTKDSNYTGAASDSTSISTYGERTKSISNHLFQSDAACEAMATTLLAVYKDPKKYLDFAAKFNAYPLELGDTLRVQLRAVARSGYGGLYYQFLYGDGTVYGSDGTVLVLRGIVRDIKISNSDATYRLELA